MTVVHKTRRKRGSVTSFVVVASNVYRRTVTAAKYNMWHGTSSTFLRSIMKQGILPSPKARVWGNNGEEDPYHEPGILRESLKGSYWTEGVKDALEATQDASTKFGGDPLLVYAQIESRTPGIAIDEDFSLEARTVAYKQYADLDWPEQVLDDYLDQRINWDDFAHWWIGEFLGKWDLPAVRIRNLLPYVKHALQKQTQLYIQENYLHDEMYQDEGESRERFETELGLDSRVKADFKEAWEDLFEKFKELATRPSEGYDPEENVLRVTFPVAFKGVNHIEAIVEFDVLNPRFWMGSFVYSKHEGVRREVDHLLREQVFLGEKGFPSLRWKKKQRVACGNEIFTPQRATKCTQPK